MDSFHNTYWDPKEMLPYDYARIYRVSKHHYKRLKKISVKALEDNEDSDNLMAEVISSILQSYASICLLAQN